MSNRDISYSCAIDASIVEPNSESCQPRKWPDRPVAPISETRMVQTPIGSSSLRGVQHRARKNIWKTHQCLTLMKRHAGYPSLSMSTLRRAARMLLMPFGLVISTSTSPRRSCVIHTRTVTCSKDSKLFSCKSSWVTVTVLVTPPETIGIPPLISPVKVDEPFPTCTAGSSSHA